MSTPRVSRTLARAMQTRLQGAPMRCYTTSRLLSSGRENCRSGMGVGVKSSGFSREIARVGQIGQLRRYSQENEGKSKHYTFEDVRPPPSSLPLPHN